MQQKHELLLQHAKQQSDGARLIMALLNTASMIDRACASELSAFELSEGRLAVLLAVANAEEAATPAFVAEQLGVSRAAITGLIDGLERQQLLQRAANGADRRSIVLHLTNTGRAVLDRIGPRYGEWLAALSDGIEGDALGGALAALGAIQRNVANVESESVANV